MRNEIFWRITGETNIRKGIGRKMKVLMAYCEKDMKDEWLRGAKWR